MTFMPIDPYWVVLRPKVAILEPFLNGEESIPPLIPGIWLGRLVWDYDEKTTDNTAKANAWICEDKDYDFKSLHLKARNQTRKAEKEGAKVSKVDWGTVWEFLPALVRQTFERQGRNSAQTFLEYLYRLRELDSEKWAGAVDLWIAEREGVVGALIIGMKYGSTYHILHQLSDTHTLSWCPNNLVAFRVTQYALKELMCIRVNYGVDGLDQGRLDGLATFKTRMGYKLLPCKEQFIGKTGVIPGIKLLSSFSVFILWAFPSLLRIDTLRILKGLGQRI